jgi:hypothetical protein
MVGRMTRIMRFPSNDDTLTSSPPWQLAFQDILGGIGVATMSSSNDRKTFAYIQALAPHDQQLGDIANVRSLRKVKKTKALAKVD